jgi:hypothetical protein
VRWSAIASIPHCVVCCVHLVEEGKRRPEGER